MKISDLKQWCNRHQDNDRVIFCTYNESAEAFVSPVAVDLKVCKPKPTDFYHRECRNCELIEVKGVMRTYCNRINDFISADDLHSCESFQHCDEDVSFCLNCSDGCFANYECKAIK